MSEATQKKRLRKNHSTDRGKFRIPIATKLILGYVAIIVITSAVFTAVGIRLIADRLVKEAQETVRLDLNAGREIYNSSLNHVYDVVRLTGARFFLSDAITSGNIQDAASELKRIKISERLDLLTVTDKYGNVLLRINNPNTHGDSQSHNDLVAAVLERNVAVASTTIISAEDLNKETPLLAEQAYFKFIDTPLARARNETEETAGMMLMAATPIRDDRGALIGVLYGGVLLNRNYEIVDEIKQTVFQGLEYKGQDIGTATIFQDDVRISTNVKNQDGSRAVGTRIMENVYSQVIFNGEPWIGRAYVVNNWYITAYEPIENINHQRIGILYVGVSEQKYTDIKRDATFVFLTITIIGALVSMMLSYYIARRISRPINRLVSASREVASGNLDAKVESRSNDELGELAISFNTMAAALKQRDEKLKEYTTSKIMESERLAIIGQLSAGVAHELNNPLQGIVSYSHLLLETMPNEEWSRGNVEKIVTQANRCKDIVRGLLDFSRQRVIEKRLYDVNMVLKECVSLLENQALFHNIQIVSNFDPKLPLVVFDPSQIERVFMNIIINAAEAMEGKGKLILTTKFDPAENVAEIGFRDTGPGISKENLEKIFSPFFTTKDPGHGTGLGLAISYGIVKEHKGTLSVESEVAKGTTFIVRLPVKAEETGITNG
ncbi:MAG: integral membrane sensor signal transduction histidine kinase [Anaerolineaceae bacterium]|nr:MAG: integral membrane sensor signal transduction histidine kinase [Anaerolineaceae bacterium]